MSEDQFSLESLGILTDELAVLSTAGGDFTAGSMIAPVTSRVMWWFMVSEDVDIYQYNQNNEEKLPEPEAYNSYSGYNHLYYGDYEVAETVRKILNPEGYSVREKWVHYCDTASVINRTPEQMANMLEKFGPQVLFDVRVMGLRKGTRERASWDRHQYTLLSLPSAVAAVANAYNYGVEYDLEEILSSTNVEDWNDERFFEMCGHPDGDFEDCVLFTRRAALWAELGEQDPKKDQAIGSLTAQGKKSSRATKSEKLSKCLKFIQGTWSKPVWVRLVSATNPAGYHVNDKGKKDQPKTIPIITEIFKSEADARAAAKAELEAKGEESSAGGDVPTQWVTSGFQEWIDYVRKEDKPTVTATSPQGPRDSLIAELYADTFDQIVAAREYIKEHPG